MISGVIQSMRNMGVAVDEAKEMPTAFGGRRTSDNIGSLFEL